MMEKEFFPILIGLFSGALVGRLRPSLRLPVGTALSILFGVMATVLSGEFNLSWGFLLIDIPLVGVSAFVGFALLRYLRMRKGQSEKIP